MKLVIIYQNVNKLFMMFFSINDKIPITHLLFFLRVVQD
jgi:hypothetical protein